MRCARLNGRLQDAGVGGDDIGTLTREAAPEERIVDQHTQDESGITGAAVGTAIGGTTGWVAGVAAASALLTVPVAGPVLAGGAIAGIVSAGGTLGWLAGGLAGEGMAEPEARHYQQAIRLGSPPAPWDNEAQWLSRIPSQTARATPFQP